MSLSESLTRARAVRKEAKLLALRFAAERDSCGDPEGAQVLEDLAREIDRIKVGPRP